MYQVRRDMVGLRQRVAVVGDASSGGWCLANRRRGTARRSRPRFYRGRRKTQSILAAACSFADSPAAAQKGLVRQ